MTKKKSVLQKIGGWTKGNGSIEFYKQKDGKYTFIVYIYEDDATTVKDSMPSQEYTSSLDCIFSGIIQFWNLKAVHA